MKWLDRLLQQLRVRQAGVYIKHGARVLDIGSADGTLYRALRGLDSYIGIDPDAPTSSTWPNARFIRGTFPTPALDVEKPFDVIAALAVLEHIPRSEQEGFARACAQYLVPEGYIVITVPAPLVDRMINALKRARLLDGMHENEHYGYDPRDTTSLFESQGLTLFRHRRFELGLNHLFVFQRGRV